MTRARLLWLCLAAVLTFCSGAFGKTFPVSSETYKTLNEVRDAVRELPKGEPVEIQFAPGTWFVGSEPLTLSAADSGTPEAPITWSAAREGTVFSGGTVISPERFRPAVGQDAERLDPEVRSYVRILDLNEAGIDSIPQLGDRTELPASIPELFFEGKRMKIARWPNEGWAEIPKILNEEELHQENPNAAIPAGGVFEYGAEPENRPARWLKAPSVYLLGYWCFDWSSDILRVDSIDPEKHRIGLAGKHSYGLRQGNPSPRRWKAFNLIEEIDEPGEYAYDPETNRIWFYPPENLGKQTVTVAAQNQPIVKCTDVSNVTFSGFEITDGFSSGIQIAGGENVTVDNCTVRNTHRAGIFIKDGKGTTVSNSLIEETGDGGIIASGGDRALLTPSGILIENNVIRRFSEHRLCYANGVAINGVGFTVRRNEIYDAPHQAVAMNSNDSVFEYNTVHHVCMEGDDCGALYKGRNPSMRGNIIRYNYWYDIGTDRGHGVAAIYFDDGDGGDQVIGNMFIRCGEPGHGGFGTVFSHGGHGLLAENNIFIDCKRPLGSAPWDDKRWKDMLDGGLWQDRLLKEVDITGPVYTEHYPELIGFMNGAPAEERRSKARGNIFVRPTSEPTGNWDIDDSNIIQE